MWNLMLIGPPVDDLYLFLQVQQAAGDAANAVGNALNSAKETVTGSK